LSPRQVIDIFIGIEKISCTPEHPFWVEGQGWVFAFQLKRGTILKTRKGQSLVIDEVRRRNEVTQVYNVEIDGLHTYFVSTLEILSHNACGGVNNVPNPGGRLGNAKTRTKTQEVIDDLDSRGFTDIQTEVRFRPGSQGSGKNRFVDVVGKNPKNGQSEIVQIGKTLKSDSHVPISRERKALDDIISSPDIQNFSDSRIRFVDVNQPGVIQP
jgi:Pretoxin HINT domain